MKTWIIRLLIVAVIGGGVWWKFFRGNGEVEITVLEPEVVEIERGNLRVVVEATGKVVPNASVDVKSEASGELLILPFEEGDRVQEGDLLVELDPDDERRNVERAESSLRSTTARLSQAQSRLSLMESDAERTESTSEANLRQAQARYDDAEARYNRRQGLHAEGVLSEEELESARTSFEDALSGLQNAQANYDDAQSFPLNIELARQDVVLAEVQVRDSEIQLEETRERYSETRIISPADGVITDLQVEVGTIVASGISNVGGGTTLMVISDLSRMFIEVEVDETDIGQVIVSQECEIIADAFPEKTLPGFVEWIAPQGTEENNITSFDVKVEIDLERLEEQVRDELERGVAGDANPANAVLAEWGLRPNMTARVEVIIADLEDVVLVPNEAIQQDDETRRRYIEVVVEGASPEVVAVETPEVATAEEESAGPPRGGRPDGRSGGGRPGGGNRDGGFGRDEGPSDEELGIQVVAPPPTERRYLDFGVSDGVQTHVISGLEAEEEVLIPIPEWRLEFLRTQAMGDDDNNRRRRRGF